MQTPSHHLLALFGTIFVLTASFWVRYEIDTRFQMALTHAHFTEAVRSSKKNMNTLTATPRSNSYTADGVPTLGGTPRNTGEWIALFNESARYAPEGGPAYIVNSHGNATTGAIGVSATKYGREVQIVRPAFRSLTSSRIIVSSAGAQHASSSKIKS